MPTFFPKDLFWYCKSPRELCRPPPSWHSVACIIALRLGSSGGGALDGLGDMHTERFYCLVFLEDFDHWVNPVMISRMRGRAPGEQ